MSSRSHLRKIDPVFLDSVDRQEENKIEHNIKKSSKLLGVCNKHNIVFSQIESAIAATISEEQNCRVLFHGSKSGIKEDITPKSRVICDFGKGFYMSTDLYQPLSLICDSDEAKLYVLSMDTSGLLEESFATDLDWMLFVAFNRGYTNDFKDSKFFEKYKK